MSRLKPAFDKVKNEGKTAFIGFITAGDPDMQTTVNLVLSMEKAGATAIELGIPFSDSIADGPTIQLANERSLKHGTSIKDILQAVKEIRKSSQIPLLLMGSYNPLYIYGVEKFCKNAGDAGVDGLIIADILPDASEELTRPARENGIDVVFLAAPTSTDERLKIVGREAGGFVYAVSLTGVTGERSELPKELGDFVRHIRDFTDLPVCVGFGIGTPEVAKSVSKIADGVIVGSAIVKRIAERAEKGEDPCEAVAAFIKSVVDVL
jgi:tryptophan synthase alpha chain